MIWVADGVEVPEQSGEAVYRKSELRQLVGKSPAEIRAIHAAKRAIDGELVQ